MKEAYYILDEPLPLSQDFRSLRLAGLEFIQLCMDSNWTNLNASDPGVTILDQVCFALTELGYCNDFEMKDILTGPHKKLEIRDQFYLPEEILTTAPLTVTDYIKYTVDGVEGVDNLIIIPNATRGQFPSGTYSVWVLPNPAIKTEAYPQLCKAVYYYLNKSRNLGEAFLMPDIIPASRPNFLNATITIENETLLNSVVISLQEAIRNYIFPKVVQAGYMQLSEAGASTNSIFNGPRLKNGWILNEAIGSNKTVLNASELMPLIRSIKGVTGVSDVSFNTPPVNVISVTGNQLLVVDISTSIKNKTLVFESRGKSLTMKSAAFIPIASLAGKTQLSTEIAFGTWNESQTPLPKGKYREIDSYYSIQNTMPEIFGVGSNSIDSNATEFRIAQSQQLKGYLTLFDQVLANQFSQLAALPRLLSFKNPVSGIPSQEKYFYAYKDGYEKKHDEYPVPFRAFSPTYFYRSLYNIPHIEDLLRDNEVFNFSSEIRSALKEEKKVQFDYEQDPYNAYMWGLMELMEDDAVNLERRNVLLDHLLARHGESPLIIDTLIDGSVYAGETKKDQIIFKSLYLQNLGLLSYYRQKAYNFLGANKLPEKLKEVPDNYYDVILGGDLHDALFETRKIDRLEKLRTIDFISFSALELKFSLLFGLKKVYGDYIGICRHDVTILARIIAQTKSTPGTISEREQDEINKVLERHNIKSQLPLYNYNIRNIFEKMENVGVNEVNEIKIIFEEKGLAGIPAIIDVLLKYSKEEITEIIALLELLLPGAAGWEANLEALKKNIAISAKLAWWLITERRGCILVEATPYLTVPYTQSANRADPAEVPGNKLYLIFPAFIPQLGTHEFRHRLDLYLKCTAPVHVSHKYRHLDVEELENFITVFTRAYNALRFKEKEQDQTKTVTNYCEQLIDLLGQQHPAGI